MKTLINKMDVMAEATMATAVTDVDAVVEDAVDHAADHAVASILAGSFAAVDVEDVIINN
ncbi:hypothetical protein [Priestia koreensis]|uniref:hypothetical protein n=1 Tax=Priestia koreensis TaxID=284581 RepID=UPI00345A592D